jgi:transcriptional regulator with XRE-family HTH domain
MPAFEPIGPQVRIRELRQAQGLTVEELAGRIGEQGVTISRSALTNVETGAKRASRDLLTAWAKALGVNPLDVWQRPARSDDQEPAA